MEDTFSLLQVITNKKKFFICHNESSHEISSTNVEVTALPSGKTETSPSKGPSGSGSKPAQTAVMNDEMHR